ncbi:MAG: hypothetical protein O2809_04690 [Proteobacteria bacterium]|nr:hypothetical protein [Pseudomonadota bacterium]
MKSVYVAHKLALGGKAIVKSVKQGCNAMMLSLQEAYDGDSKNHALLVCADRFNTTSFSRWSSDYNIVYGDAACAIEIGDGAGQFSIEYMDTLSIWDMEELHSNLSFQPLDQCNQFDVKVCKKKYLLKCGKEALTRNIRSSITLLYHQMVRKMSISITDINYFILPNLGAEFMNNSYFQSLEIPVEKSSYTWGRGVGHLGGGDAFIALDVANKSGKFKEGDRVLLMGAGAGFSWTLLLLRKTNHVRH